MQKYQKQGRFGKLINTESYLLSLNLIRLAKLGGSQFGFKDKIGTFVLILITS